MVLIQLTCISTSEQLAQRPRHTLGSVWRSKARRTTRFCFQAPWRSSIWRGWQGRPLQCVTARGIAQSARSKPMVSAGESPADSRSKCNGTRRENAPKIKHYNNHADLYSYSIAQDRWWWPYHHRHEFTSRILFTHVYFLWFAVRC